MLTLRRVVLPLRVLLATTFLALVVLQTFSFPGQFAYMARTNPEDADLRWPLTAFTALVLLCVQVVIVCTWRLLTMVERDRIFSGPSLRWVDAIVWAIAAAWAMFFSFASFVVLQADDPGVALLFTVLLLVGAVLGLLMLVMRTLLQQAITLRTDMESVI